MKTMQAVRLVPQPEGSRFEVQEIPRPEVGPGQVLVRAHASGLNRGELMLADFLRAGDAMTNGVEYAGEVAAVGAGVTDWREGDRVMGHGAGAQAQYVLADPRALMRVPAQLGWVEASTFPNVFITAHDAVATNGELREGEAILVNGASGGVAIAAMQIASLMGAKHVIGTSRSADKLARLGDFGMTCGIDTSRQSQLEVVEQLTDKRGVDVVIDTIGGAVFADNVKMLGVKGRLVHVSRPSGDSATIDLTALWHKRLRIIGVTFRTRTPAERLACIQGCVHNVLPWLELGLIRLPVDRAFPMAQVQDAYEYMRLDQHIGKLAITLD
jgi:NADPH2:quinone reductase